MGDYDFEDIKDSDRDSSGCPADGHEEPEVYPPPPKTKDPRSKYKYNIFCRIYFLWLDGLFFTGCHHDLRQQDLYAHPSETDSKKLYKKFTRYWVHELERKRRGLKPRLWLTIAKCYWWRIIVQGIMFFSETVALICQAFLLGLLTQYFNLPSDIQSTHEETRNAYLYATGMVVLALIAATLHSHSFLAGHKIGMMCRVMMTSAIYKKVLSLNQITIGKVSTGKIINLASNDVQRFDMAFQFIHTVWLTPPLLAVVTYLLYLQLGWAALIPCLILMIQVPVQLGLGKIYAKLRFESAMKTDHRVRIMNEVITGIRVIKMYAWEYAFKRVVNALRKHESRLIRYGGVITALTSAFTFSAILQLLLGLSVIVFVATGGELTARRVFTSFVLLIQVGRFGGTFLIRGIFFLYEAHVATTRIQEFLLLDEISPTFEVEEKADKKVLKSLNSQATTDGYFRESPHLPSTHKVTLEPVELTSYTATPTGNAVKTAVRVSSLAVSWKEEQDKLVLEDISFDVDHTAPLLAVVGPVGSGKSTLLQCLLGELEPAKGTVTMGGRISYASQDPWVFSGTVRENILFGHPYRKEWYDRVVKGCALDKDMELLVDGDLTLVGERGVTLSGGQKARVNLARAVYHEADVYLLDDPLSAVDTGVGKHLFEECIRGLLKDKLVILVTHQVHFALQGDKLLALKDGSVHMYGSHAELSERNIDTTKLLGLIGEDDASERDEFAYKDASGEDSEKKSFKMQRMVSVEGPKSPLLSPQQGAVEFKLAEEENEEDESGDFPESAESSEPETRNAPPPEEKAHGSISTMTYINYFRTGANYLVLFIVMVFFITGEISVVVTDWWISDWATSSQLNSFNSSVAMMVEESSSSCPIKVTSDSLTCDDATRLLVYGLLIFAVIVLNLLRGCLFYLVCNNAARILHNKMFRAILRTPVLFFDTNPSGRILNRFSKDIGFLDDLLPQTLLEFLLLILRFIAIIIVVAVALPFILIPLPFILVLFLVIRWYFLKTSRAVKRLEAIARSPVYSHISTTLQGLPTIRTFSQQEIAISHFHTFNNEHSKGWYLYIVMARWFSIRLDFLSTLILICAAYLSIALVSLPNTNLNPALLGLGLTYIVTLSNMLQFCVRLSTEVENIMISTERIMEYGRLKPEASLETLPPNQKPPDDWPKHGELSMEDVAFRYAPELPMVLKNLSFSLRPSEKVGIVGRTGAGKSSLLSVLFRLAEPYGQVTIDGVDTKTIGLHDLRKKMSIIPQDPVLFSGSMRYNLDPFDEYSDAELWEVLEQVQLKAAVQEIEGQLSGEVSEGGSNFSVGQRQLACLARALLRRNKILILDEATANVDPKTDDIIQKAIREKFTKCTVLTIAHRLNTIMDSDRIVVMSNGEAKECASPYRLLQNPDSQFYKMVEKTGPEAAQKLHQMASNARSD